MEATGSTHRLHIFPNVLSYSMCIQEGGGGIKPYWNPPCAPEMQLDHAHHHSASLNLETFVFKIPLL